MGCLRYFIDLIAFCILVIVACVAVWGCLALFPILFVLTFQYHKGLAIGGLIVAVIWAWRRLMKE